MPCIARGGTVLNLRPLLSHVGWWVVSTCLVLAHTPSAWADAQTDYLVGLLERSSQFRVRTKAAISLAESISPAQASSALIAALRDAHPAVRIAAAGALAELGSKEALPDLRHLLRDREALVRKAVQQAMARLLGHEDGAVRYYVAIGTPGSRVQGVDGPTLDAARQFLSTRIAALPTVEVAPPDEAVMEAQAILQRRHLKGYAIQTSITSVQARPGGGTRVAVSMIVATYPEHNMRAILQGAATAVGQGSDTFRQAVEGALSGALRKLPQAMEN